MADMQYVSIPNVEKKVSRIFYGTAGQLFMKGGDANELLDSIYAAGVNAFDCARAYMLAEKSLGKWVADRGLRDKVAILSKCGHPGAFGRKRINEKDIRRISNVCAGAKNWQPLRTARFPRSRWHGSISRT